MRLNENVRMGVLEEEQRGLAWVPLSAGRVTGFS